MNRAFSLFTVKSVNEGKRTITGIATTPEVDRVGDVIDSLGVSFKNPLPFLWMHDSSKPIGTVKFDKPTKTGITFEATLPQVDEPGVLQDRINEAWQSIKLGLVRAVSVGFRPIEYSHIQDGGIHFTSVEVMELSAVTIPAQASAVITGAKSLDRATIDVIKQFDTAPLAATGHKQSDDVTKPAGASATRSTPVVKAQEGRKAMAKKTIAEQIAGFEATRVAKSARMDAIMDDSAEKGETLGTAEKEEYDGLETEVKEIDEHLVRLRAREKANVAAAVVVTGDNTDNASRSRAGVRVENVRSNVPKGIAFARYAIAKMVSARELVPAADVAKARWPDMPELQEVLKSAVAAGSSTTMSDLVIPQVMASEFVEFLWPKTIIGRIPGLRRVPFNIKVQRQTSVSSVNWVGEGKPKPVSKGAFDTVTLGYFKIAGIVGLTDEIVRFASPSSEAMVRDELANAVIKLMDKDFLDPEKAAVANVSPASLTNGVSAISSTGTTYAYFVADFASVMANFDAAEIDTGDLVVVTRSRQARALGLMLNSLGQPLFPGLGASGGQMLGLPVITSTNVDYTEDSPQEGDNIIFIKPGDVLLADDGQVTIDVSREASVQMDDSPDDPATASTVMVSAFQQNLVFVRAERYINWLKRRSAAVQYIKAAKYA